jgi:hypothetical protein
MPKGDRVGGGGQFGGDSLERVIRAGNDRATVIHGWFPLLWRKC